eukprot:2914053-Rhodomonas_salina.1
MASDMPSFVSIPCHSPSFQRYRCDPPGGAQERSEKKAHRGGMRWEGKGMEGATKERKEGQKRGNEEGGE